MRTGGKIVRETLQLTLEQPREGHAGQADGAPGPVELAGGEEGVGGGVLCNCQINHQSPLFKPHHSYSSLPDTGTKPSPETNNIELS